RLQALPREGRRPRLPPPAGERRATPARQGRGRRRAAPSPRREPRPRLHLRVSEAASGPTGGAGHVGLGRATAHRFGSGWISGVLSVTCGALGYGGVLCLLFPSFLTTPSARALYPMDLVRFLIYVLLVLGFRPV